jgi:hypothetical protein
MYEEDAQPYINLSIHVFIYPIFTIFDVYDYIQKKISFSFFNIMFDEGDNGHLAFNNAELGTRRP